MKIILSLLIMIIPNLSYAHVKWFSDYNFNQPPLELSQINNVTFWGLFLLSVVSLPLIVWLDKVAEKSHIYNATNGFLDQYSGNGQLIMRVTMGAVLLMSWQGDSIVAPEIAISSPVWGWIEFFLALCLIFKKTIPITGLGIIIFWLMGIGTEGLFHMLDYVIYPAVGLYLILSNLKSERFRNLDLPVLYSGLGFSLCWVAFEKIFYPFWGLSVLAQAPALTMGLNHQFFLIACAFVEFTLGYLLIICLLHRPLAIVITLVFFITTSFFGKTEVVGHTILHGALLVFIVKGPGDYYQAPIRFHKSLWMRALFAMVNFIVVFGILILPYQHMAQKAYADAQTKRAAEAHPRFLVPAGSPMPSIIVHPYKDSKGGWNIHIMTQNFKFTPENAGKDDANNEGHAHLYVDGKKSARVYGDWIHLTLPKGKHKVRVDLTTNSHKDYYHGDKPIGAEVEVDEDRAVSPRDHVH